MRRWSFTEGTPQALAVPPNRFPPSWTCTLPAAAGRGRGYAPLPSNHMVLTSSSPPGASVLGLAAVAGLPYYGCHVVVAVPLLRHRAWSRLRGSQCSLYHGSVTSSSSRCSGIGLGRGCGTAVVVAVLMLRHLARPRLRAYPPSSCLSRRRRRPDAPASASAAVAGWP